MLVQLVRRPACHDRGHEFEPRAHRWERRSQESQSEKKMSGALVQLVRMPACHAGGHEFESRTHRRKAFKIILEGFFCCMPGMIVCMFICLACES